MKTIFVNSTGSKVMLPKKYQDLAPLTSVPKTKSPTKSKTQRKYKIKTKRGLFLKAFMSTKEKETANKMPPAKKSICFWKLEKSCNDKEKLQRKTSPKITSKIAKIKSSQSAFLRKKVIVII